MVFPCSTRMYLNLAKSCFDLSSKHYFTYAAPRLLSSIISVLSLAFYPSDLTLRKLLSRCQLISRELFKQKYAVASKMHKNSRVILLMCQTCAIASLSFNYFVSSRYLWHQSSWTYWKCNNLHLFDCCSVSHSYLFSLLLMLIMTLCLSATIDNRTLYPVSNT